jgi:hypothetical protein
VVLQAALVAVDEVDANFYTTMAQIMRGYHETVSPLIEVRRVAGLLVAQSKGGPTLIPLPLDYGVWTERADRLSDELKAKDAAPGFNGRFDFWVMGNVSPQVKQQLAQKGIPVVEEVHRPIEIID